MTNNLPSFHLDDQIPGDLAAYPAVQLSEYSNWASVARWGAKIFISASKPLKEVKKIAGKLKHVTDDDMNLVLRALRFVQDEIRYLGIEFGINSHKPYSPHIVLKRRFGDCKDKSLLLTLVLHELGIKAWPVLVNSECKRYKCCKGLGFIGEAHSRLC